MLIFNGVIIKVFGLVITPIDGLSTNDVEEFITKFQVILVIIFLPCSDVLLVKWEKNPNYLPQIS